MKQLYSRLDSVLGAGSYLLGAFQLSEVTTLVHAVLQARPPRDGAMEIGLEIGGEVVQIFSIGANPIDQKEIVIFRALNLTVDADTLIRWKVISFTSPIEDGPLKASATIGYTSAGIASALDSAPDLWVNWVDGEEKIRLFDYDAASSQFSESLEGEGLSASRAAVETYHGDHLRISIRDDDNGGRLRPVLWVVSGIVECEELDALVGVATSEEPRLEFVVNGERIATLSAGGVFRVACVQEGDTPADVDEDAFAFQSQGRLSATLSRELLVCSGIRIL